MYRLRIKTEPLREERQLFLSKTDKSEDTSARLSWQCIDNMRSICCPFCLTYCESLLYYFLRSICFFCGLGLFVLEYFLYHVYNYTYKGSRFAYINSLAGNGIYIYIYGKEYIHPSQLYWFQIHI